MWEDLKDTNVQVKRSLWGWRVWRSSYHCHALNPATTHLQSPSVQRQVNCAMNYLSMVENTSMSVAKFWPPEEWTWCNQRQPNDVVDGCFSLSIFLLQYTALTVAMWKSPSGWLCAHHLSDPLTHWQRLHLQASTALAVLNSESLLFLGLNVCQIVMETTCLPLLREALTG